MWPPLQRKFGASGLDFRVGLGSGQKTAPRGQVQLPLLVGPGGLELQLLSQGPHPGQGHRSPAPMGPMNKWAELRKGTRAGTLTCATSGWGVGNRVEKGLRGVILTLSGWGGRRMLGHCSCR